jgi:hypothetical protein
MSGGARPGAGRPSKAEEQRTAALAKAAITGKFGSVEEGFQWLLESKEPSLIKFVFEHAFGKPQDKVDLSGDLKHTVTYQVVRERKSDS